MNVSAMKVERTKKGFSQPKLELLVSIPQWRLSLIERGIAAKEDEIKKISSALGVEPSKIFSNGRVKDYIDDDTRSDYIQNDAGRNQCVKAQKLAKSHPTTPEAIS